MIKIVHTADLHFGLEFSRFGNLADQLKEERLNALKLIVKRANDTGAHAIVVAGDLFDKLTISHKLVKAVKSILSSFTGEVFVIPGNHDWFNPSANENKVWECFIEAKGDNVHFLEKLETYQFTLNNKEVVFYPCGCHQRHCEDNLLKWVSDSTKDPAKINIGIAHGNVEGYGLDEEGNYFPMTQAELKETGMDCWLLGHIHAPYPGLDTAGHEGFFFAGNHCPDSWKSERPGGTWLIQIDDDKKVKGTRWHHDGIVFKDRSYDINNINDVHAVVAELNKMNAKQTVLRLSLKGSLNELDLQECKSQISEATESFFYKEVNWNIVLKITSDIINQVFAKDSIPHTLLTQLSSNNEDTLAMQLAYQTIKNLSI